VGILGKSSNEKDVAGVHISNCIINGTKNGVRVKAFANTLILVFYIKVQ